MVRYFYAWIPLVLLVGTVVVLTIPYLAVIVLLAVLIAAAAAVGSLAWAFVAGLYALGRSAIGPSNARDERERTGARQPVALKAGPTSRRSGTP
jgi:hypothetical protein